MRRSLADENYLKAIFHLSDEEGNPVGTGVLAEFLKVSAASVTDKMKKLQKKGWLDYQKSKGVVLSDAGRKIALLVIRKHRLWEQFLVEVLGFEWDEVHDVAEQLEHVESEMLVERLDQYLGHPKVDPHGDPIPDKEGKIASLNLDTLADVAVDYPYEIISVDSQDADLLRFLDKKGLVLNTGFTLNNREEYDKSVVLTITGKSPISLSDVVARKIRVKPLKNTLFN